MSPLVYTLTIILTIAGWFLCIISLLLSTVLFKSIGTTPFFIGAFGTAAVMLEVIKFSLAPIATYLYYKGKHVWASVLGLLFIGLMSFSILASMAGLNENTNKDERAYVEAIEKKARKQDEIAQLEANITQRNKDIEFYRNEKLIKLEVVPRQAKNEIDQARIKELNDEIDLIVIPDRSMMIEGIELIATAFGTQDLEFTKAVIYVVFSIFLDFFGSLALIVSEFLYLNRKTEKDSSEELDRERKMAEAIEQREHELSIARIQASGQIMANKKAAPVFTPQQPQTPEARQPKPATEQSQSAKVVQMNTSPSPEAESGVSDAVKEARLAIDNGVIPEHPSPRILARSLGMPSNIAMIVSEKLAKA